MGLPALSEYKALLGLSAARVGPLKFTPSSPLGPMELARYCGWLKRLKKSIWNCILTRSVSLKFLRKDRSTSLLPGPEQTPKPSLPFLPIWKPFRVNMLGLNHCRESPVLARQPWPATRIGTSLPPPPVPERSPMGAFPVIPVIEGPVATLMMELISHAPKAFLTKRFCWSSAGRL